MEFYTGSLLSPPIATDRTAPYEATWTPTRTGGYTLRAVAYDRQGLRSQSDPVSVGYDITPPTVSVGQSPRLAASSVGKKRAFHRLNFVGNPVPDVDHFLIQRRVDHGPWRAFEKTERRHVRDRLEAGREYQYRVKATDLVGNWSSWSESPLVSYRVVSELKAARTRGWQRVSDPNALGGYLMRSDTRGANLTFKGRGRTDCAVIGRVGPGLGRARLHEDGDRPQGVHFASEKTRHRRSCPGAFCIVDGSCP